MAGGDTIVYCVCFADSYQLSCFARNVYKLIFVCHCNVVISLMSSYFQATSATKENISTAGGPAGEF